MLFAKSKRSHTPNRTPIASLFRRKLLRVDRPNWSVGPSNRRAIPFSSLALNSEFPLLRRSVRWPSRRLLASWIEDRGFRDVVLL